MAFFYPPTNRLNLGASTENPGDGGPPESYVRAFGPRSTILSEWRVIGREMSPIFHVGPDPPPILIVHGDADTLVPLEQSQRFAARAAEFGRRAELVVRPGRGYGWITMLWDVRLFGEWFNRHLLAPRAWPRSGANVPDGGGIRAWSRGASRIAFPLEQNDLCAQLHRMVH